MEFPRQEHWRGLPLSSPGGLPNPGIEPRSPALKADSKSILLVFSLVVLWLPVLYLSLYPFGVRK